MRFWCGENNQTNRSFLGHTLILVEQVTNSRERQFEIHINIREKPSTGVVRGVGVGRKHLDVTADTNGRTMIPNMRHCSILREISALQSIRTRKGKRRKRKIEKKIIQLRQKANNIANDSMNRVVRAVTEGVDKVILEDLSPKANDQSWREPEKNNEPLHA